MLAHTREPLMLSPIDNLMPRFHISKILFFPASELDATSIFSSLITGLERTFRLLPLLSGTIKVISDGVQRGRLVVAEPWHAANEVLTFKDLRDNAGLDYAEIRESHFPAGSIRPEFVNIPQPVALEQPVLCATLNQIRGGLILSISMHHCFTDGNGTATFTRIWCSLCQAEHTDSIGDTDLVSRHRLMGELDLATVDEFPELVYEVGGGSEVQTNRIAIPPQPEPVTRIIFFSHEKLKELKTLVSSGDHSGSRSTWISTLDALASLLWCSQVVARRSCDNAVSGTAGDRARQDNVESSYYRPVRYTKDDKKALRVVINGRQLLHPPLSPNFIGNVMLFARVQTPLDEVTTTPDGLSNIAFSLRDSINTIDLSYLERYLSALCSVEDISAVQVKPENLITSWRSQDFYSQDWEKVFGTGCDRVRSFLPLPPTLALVMPEVKGSACNSSPAGIEVALGIAEDTLPYLKRDEILNRFGEWR